MVIVGKITDDSKVNNKENIEDNNSIRSILTNFNKNNLINNNIDIETNIQSKNGAFYESRKVFTQAFKFIKEQMLNIISNKLNVNDTKDIQWIVTVPAIWSDYSKNMMLKSGIIYNAGMIDPNMHII